MTPRRPAQLAQAAATNSTTMTTNRERRTLLRAAVAVALLLATSALAWWLVADEGDRPAHAIVASVTLESPLDPELPMELSQPAPDLHRVAGSMNALPAAAPPADPERRSGTVEIKVIGPAELTVQEQPATVRVFARRRSRRATVAVGQVAVGGSLHWTPPSDDEYLLGTVPDSLPQGWIGTGTRDLGQRHGEKAGLVPCPTTATAPRTVELHVVPARSLSGYVTDATGEPLEGVTVRAQAMAPGLQRLTEDVSTDADGRFRIDGLYPLVHSLRLVDPGDHARLFAAAPRPAPRLHDLALGSESGIELALGRGTLQISGRVVDRRGKGVPDLSLIIYYLEDAGSGVALDHERGYTWNDSAIELRTDRQGAFQVAGLDRVGIAIQAGAWEATNGPTRRLRFVPPPVHVQPHRNRQAQLRVPAIRVERSRRFTVTGRVAVNGLSAAGVPLSEAGLQVEGIRFSDAQSAHGPPGLERQPSVTFDAATRTLTASCDTPRDALELRLTHRALPGVERRFRFLPIPDGHESSAVLSFP